MWTSIFDWSVVGVAVPIIIGFGWVLVSIQNPQFNGAQAAFTLAALILVAKLAYYVVIEEGHKHSSLQVGVFSFLCFGAIASIWVLSLRWVSDLRPYVDHTKAAKSWIAVDQVGQIETLLADG
jgi:hypothetical protein